MDKYVLGGVIGEGQFGSVRKATVKQSGVSVAIKQIRINRTSEGLPHPVARELLISAALHCPFIVRTIEVLPFGSSVAMVMELCRSDLGNLLSKHSFRNPLPSEKVKQYLEMLLLALDYLHRRNILHRDVKPSNCFLSTDGVIKLGDFGLSRIVASDMSHEVASRWYRAPELLFGSRTYGPEVDLWSVGCVFAEMLTGYSGALFAGDGDLNQLSKIFDVLGTPTLDCRSYYERLPDWGKVHFNEKSGSGLSCHFVSASAPALDLLCCLLHLDPREETLSTAGLKHAYFCS